MNKQILTITTDLSDNRWLKYILKEFLRINNAQFELQVLNKTQTNINNKNVLYYFKNCTCKNTIPNRSGIHNDICFSWLSKEIYIIKDTLVDGWKGVCSYDIFWNAFFFLSRIEEYRIKNNPRKINSYVKRHPRKDKDTFDIAIVNNLFDELERIIKFTFTNLEFNRKCPPVFELTHDVDYLKKTLQLKIKKATFDCYNAVKTINNPSVSRNIITSTKNFLFSNPSYRCFDYWESIEKKFNQRSTFYIYVKYGKKSFRSWLIDPSYNIINDKALQRSVKHLDIEGFEIGLHGSYDSATDEEILVSEKKILENIIEKPVLKIRQHWLRYDESITPFLHNKYFKYDSTLGWNDKIGFRSGCASRYRPYDHEKQEPYNYLVTPQVIMDSTIFDYQANRRNLEGKKAIQLIDAAKQYKNTHIAISWHQRVCNEDYKWHGLYETILREHITRREYLQKNSC